MKLRHYGVNHFRLQIERDGYNLMRHLGYRFEDARGDAMIECTGLVQCPVSVDLEKLIHACGFACHTPAMQSWPGDYPDIDTLIWMGPSKTRAELAGARPAYDEP